MDGQAEAITQIVTAKALEGDMMAIRLVLDRIVPVRRERPVFFELPPLKTADDAVEAMASIVGGVANGELTPTEANDLARLVDGFVKAIEASELGKHITAIEFSYNHDQIKAHVGASERPYTAPTATPCNLVQTGGTQAR